MTAEDKEFLAYIAVGIRLHHVAPSDVVRAARALVARYERGIADIELEEAARLEIERQAVEREEAERQEAERQEAEAAACVEATPEPVAVRPPWALFEREG